MSNFSIIFSAPRSGSLPVEILIGQESCNFIASNILNDPIEELVDGILHILRFSDSAIIHWWVEPNWYTLELKSCSIYSKLVIILYCNHTSRDNYLKAEKKLLTTAPEVKVYRCIASSLRTLINNISQPYYESIKAWNRKFPNHKIEEIYSAIRKLKK